MTANKIFAVAVVLTGLNFQPLFAQEKPLKNLVEHKRERKYAFYPSTLRMINLSQNPDYNEMVSGVTKLLIYQLDSAAKADRSYREIVSVYSRLGFDEYASAFGGNMSLSILGKEGRESEYVGYFGQDDVLLAFYLKGTIAWQKIPTLFQTMKEGDIINFFNLNR